MNIKNQFKKNKKLIYATIIVAIVGHANAQLEISKSTINNGGGTMIGSGFELQGSLGQVDAHASSSGSYTLNGGFWQENTDLIFKNKFQ